MPNLEKTIERTKEKIAAGQFYEAHQAVRTIATRYIRAKDYASAIDLLYATINQLLDEKQTGSASDLFTYYISVLEMAQITVDSIRPKIIGILAKFDPCEPSLKALAAEIIGWTMKFGNVPYGDPELHHVLGTVFAKADDAYAAERHLILGTSQSPPVLANLLYEWYTEDKDPNSVGLYACRGVFGYLEVQNIDNCSKLLKHYLEKFNESPAVGPTHLVDEDDVKVLVYDDHELLNFLQLLIPCCRYKNKDMFGRLKNRYSALLSSIPPLESPLSKVGAIYFGIQQQRQGNVLQDLMGSLFAPPSR